MSDPLKMARRMIYASACAYNIENDGTTASPGPGKIRHVPTDKGYFYDVAEDYQREVGFAQGPDTYTPAFFSDGGDDINAALAGLTDDGYALVAIRGTIPPSLANHDLMQWLKDWANDGDVHAVDWAPTGKANYGKAEHGFAKSALDLWTWIKGELATLKDQAPNGVLITGHSKGGAVTYLIASLVRAEWPDLAGKIEVHAFAAAVSCDADFVAAYDRAGLGARTYRYQVENDLVPFLPYWKQANFWHALHLDGFWHQAEWLAAGALAKKMTSGGFSAPGSFTYFDATHAHVPNADVTTSALPAVVKALKAEEFSKIGNAHSATGSYLKCFPPVVT